MTHHKAALIEMYSTLRGNYVRHNWNSPWTLRWRHNGRDSVSNHQPRDCSLNRLFRRRSKKTSKLRVTGLCVANSPGTGEFSAQMASNAENVSICWRHHEYFEVNIAWDYLSISTIAQTVSWSFPRLSLLRMANSISIRPFKIVYFENVSLLQKSDVVIVMFKWHSM